MTESDGPATVWAIVILIVIVCVSFSIGGSCARYEIKETLKTYNRVNVEGYMLVPEKAPSRGE